MLDPSAIHLFLAAALVLFLIPGPVVLYTVARTISQGRRAGLVSVLAAAVGDLTQVLVATAGLAALLASSPLAFGIVRYAGAAYLVYLGVRTWLSRPATACACRRGPQAAQHLWTGRRCGRAQSQGGSLSALLPSPVCQTGARLAGPADADSGHPVCAAGHADELVMGAGIQCGDRTFGATWGEPARGCRGCRRGVCGPGADVCLYRLAGRYRPGHRPSPEPGRVAPEASRCGAWAQPAGNLAPGCNLRPSIGVTRIG